MLLVHNKEEFEYILISNDSVVLIELRLFSFGLIQEYFLIDIVGILHILHVETAKIFLNCEGRDQADQRQGAPKDEAIHVVDVRRSLVG